MIDGRILAQYVIGQIFRDVLIVVGAALSAGFLFAWVFWG